MIKNLMMLVETNCIEEVQHYLDRFPPGTNDDVKSTAFLFACRCGKLEIANILLEYVTPNCRYSDGQTAIMLVSQLTVDNRGVSDFVDLLIIKGCEVDLVDFCGKAAIHWATTNNSIWAVRALISYRCNINSLDLHGFTPLIYAAKMNFGTIVSILLHSGADPTKSSKQQGTAIHQAVRSRSCEALRQLIPYYRHLNILDFRNQSPIDLAISFNNYEIVSILLDSKKDIEVNRRPSFAPFRTPLEEACLKNNIKIAEALLNAGADVNYPLEFAFEPEKRNTRSAPIAPIMFAIRNQNVDLINLLLSSGADYNIRCPKAPGYAILMTPMTLAAELGNSEILKILEDRKQPSAEYDVIDTFKAACCSHDVALVMNLVKKYNISLADSLLKNGVPVVLELFRESFKADINDEVLLDLFSISKDSIGKILNVKVAEVLSKKNFGSSMQFYRCAWLKLAEQFPSHVIKITKADEEFYIRFIISFLESFFFKKNTENFEWLNRHFQLLDVFPHRLIRLALHSSSVIKSILLSKSFYALAILVDIHFDENMAFWDQSNDHHLDVCEFALFFGNVDAALILNLSCGLSLKCINEYETWPYIPEVMNKSLDYNDVDKISALKFLSKNVKPLKTSCKFAIKRCVPCGLLLDELPRISKNMLCDLAMDLSDFICNSESGLNQLSMWAGVDPKDLNLIEF